MGGWVKLHLGYSPLEGILVYCRITANVLFQTVSTHLFIHLHGKDNTAQSSLFTIAGILLHPRRFSCTVSCVSRTTVQKKMVTATFSHNSINFKSSIHNVVSRETNFAKNMDLCVSIGPVRFTKYCGKMCSRHLFYTVD